MTLFVTWRGKTWRWPKPKEQLGTRVINEHGEVVEHEAPIVVQYVNRIICDAIYNNASAIKVGPVDLSIRGAKVYELRDGGWVEIDAVRVEFFPEIVNRLKMLSGLDYWRSDLVQLGTIHVTTQTPPNPPIQCDLKVTFTKSDTGDEILLEIVRMDG